MSRSLILAVLAVLAVPAAADPVYTTPGDPRPVVIMPPEAFTPHASQISPYLYLNRCAGGCIVHGGSTNDARTQNSSIPGAGDHTIGEFANAFGQTGTTGTCLTDNTTPCTTDAQCVGGPAGSCDTADSEWKQVVQCMKEVYSPFAVTLSESVPAGGLSYTEAIIAGNPSDIGLDAGILGIAPLAGDCSAQDNVISFSFANHHGMTQRVFNICWTAAQETAHAFGLDHEFSFVGGYEANGNSCCMDPMTYRTDCGGEKFFRNASAMCGDIPAAARACRCGGTQNSHLKILSVFGPGTSIVPAPTASVLSPTGGTVSNGFAVQAQAGSKRGVRKAQLSLNGYVWASVNGGAYGADGQPVPSLYTLTAPSNVPDGVIDIVVKAYDDLDIEGDSATITVTKGAPCTSAASCAKGQLCDAGKCYWNAATGMLGDACTYPQFCTSGICQGTADQTICTQDCIVGVTDSCPMGYDCLMTTGTNGICFPAQSGGGCCSVGNGGVVWVHGGLTLGVLGFVLRRRRRK